MPMLAYLMYEFAVLEESEERDALKYLNNFKGARDYSRRKELHNRNREAMGPCPGQEDGDIRN